MVGRFQVMALLQAARAKALGYPLDEAESFGLNRAIFYAAAKRGFKGGTSTKHPGEQHALKQAPHAVHKAASSGPDWARKSSVVAARAGFHSRARAASSRGRRVLTGGLRHGSTTGTRCSSVFARRSRF